jgi:hypothetical protein
MHYHYKLVAISSSSLALQSCMDLGLLVDPPAEIPIHDFSHHASTFSVFTSFKILSSRK